jgi:hypothetical protein
MQPLGLCRPGLQRDSWLPQRDRGCSKVSACHVQEESSLAVPGPSSERVGRKPPKTMGETSTVRHLNSGLNRVGTADVIHDCTEMASLDPLRSIAERHICPSCNQSQKFFCYDCLKVLSRPCDLSCVDKLPRSETSRFLVRPSLFPESGCH